MNGILPLWKEKGMTSHDCVFKLRKLLQTKKIGHTGTLDPNVDGVLPICVGTATKMVEFLQNSNKAYIGEITVGVSTTTEDSDGDVVESRRVDKPLLIEDIDAMMSSMVGDIVQVPPMYSAVKVNGKKLYEYARNNEIVDRPSRMVTIEKFERTSDIVYNDGKASWTFEVHCSKGTYVRTLAVDLGKKLEFPAHMSQLTRIKSSVFVPKDCITLSDIEKMPLDERHTLLHPIEKAFSNVSLLAIDDTVFERVKNGAIIPQFEHVSYPIFLTYHNKIIALYDKHPHLKGMIKPKKMLLGNLNESY